MSKPETTLKVQYKQSLKKLLAVPRTFKDLLEKISLMFSLNDLNSLSFVFQHEESNIALTETNFDDFLTGLEKGFVTKLTINDFQPKESQLSDCQPSSTENKTYPSFTDESVISKKMSVCTACGKDLSEKCQICLVCKGLKICFNCNHGHLTVIVPSSQTNLTQIKSVILSSLSSEANQTKSEIAINGYYSTVIGNKGKKLKIMIEMTNLTKSVIYTNDLNFYFMTPIATIPTAPYQNTKLLPDHSTITEFEFVIDTAGNHGVTLYAGRSNKISRLASIEFAVKQEPQLSKEMEKLAVDLSLYKKDALSELEQMFPNLEKPLIVTTLKLNSWDLDATSRVMLK